MSNISENMNLTDYVNLAGSIVSQVNYFCAVYVLTFGAFFNILTAIVFTRQVFWSTNMGFFYLLLSIVNTLGLFTGFLQRFFAALNNDLATKSDFSCKTLSFFRKFFPHMSSWIQVLITFERVACVSLHSPRLAFMKKKQNIWIIMGVIFLLVFLINTENFLFYLAVTTRNSSSVANNLTDYENITIASCKSSSTVGAVSEFVSAFVRTIIPFPLMLVMNVIISMKLIGSKKNLAKSVNNRSLKKEYQFAFTVVGMNIIFFILYFPLAVSHMTQAVIQLIPNVSPWVSTTVSLVYNVASNVAYIYMALNFFLNLGFNHLFRKELLVLIGLRTPRNDSTYV